MTVTRPVVTILDTKLQRPHVTRDLVVRPRLLQLLEDGLDGPLTLVVAPAGFGKTTLVSSWVQTLSNPDRDGHPPMGAAWLSLDERHSDRDIFLRHFIAAVRKIFPDACPETLELLNARQPAPSSLVDDTLSNEIASLPQRFVMVLDDLERSHGQAVGNFLAGWISRWPYLMHLVVLSRFAPPLPLAMLRAKGQVSEIRPSSLRFTQAETVEYFNRTLAAPLDDTSLSLVHHRLEGWAAGLKLFALSQRTQPGEQTLASQLVDTNSYIADYLLEEIVNQLPPSRQRFLLQTSIAEQFCASLCETLVDGNGPDHDVRAQIDWLEAADFFITPLGSGRKWYRFHHMFRAFLQQRLQAELEPEQVTTLHRRAAIWFARHGIPDEALEHALAAADFTLAVDVMQQYLSDVLNREDRPTLERWLHLLPESFVTENAFLLIMKAWGYGFRWEVDQVETTLKEAEALLADDDESDRLQTLRGQIAALAGHYAYYRNDPGSGVVHCRQALALLPESWLYVRGVAAVYLALCLAATGRRDDAEDFLIKQYKSAKDKTDSYVVHLLFALVIVYLHGGHYESAERVARTMLHQSTAGSLPVMQGWAHYLLGFVYYQWNNVDLAGHEFAAVVDQLFTAQWASVRNGIIGQALCFQTAGRSADALEAIDRLSQIDLQYRGHEGADTAAARARLMLLNGDLEGAGRWADAYAAPPDGYVFLPWMEHPPLTKVQILIARNRADDVRTALQILDKLQDLAERTFNGRATIEILALRALALLAQADISGARETLIRALQLARTGNFTRAFVDLGPQMHKLLLQIANQGSVAESASRILAAFSGRQAAPATVAEAAFINGRSDSRLTARELELLKLMAEPLSLQAVALQLHISYATVRRHTSNVYAKLGVHSRWEAVDLAVRTGIILPPK